MLLSSEDTEATKTSSHPRGAWSLVPCFLTGHRDVLMSPLQPLDPRGWPVGPSLSVALHLRVWVGHRAYMISFLSLQFKPSF